MEQIFQELLQRLRAKGFTFEAPTEGYDEEHFVIDDIKVVTTETKEDHIVLKETTDIVVGTLHPYQRITMRQTAETFEQRFPDVNKRKLQELVKLANEGRWIDKGKGRTGYVTYATHNNKSIQMDVNHMPLWHPVTWIGEFDLGEGKVCVYNWFDLDTEDFDELCALIEPVAKALGLKFAADASVEGF